MNKTITIGDNQFESKVSNATEKSDLIDKIMDNNITKDESETNQTDFFDNILDNDPEVNQTEIIVENNTDDNKSEPSLTDETEGNVFIDKMIKTIL